jgi:hypothetical protein
MVDDRLLRAATPPLGNCDTYGRVGRRHIEKTKCACSTEESGKSGSTNVYAQSNEENKEDHQKSR